MTQYEYNICICAFTLSMYDGEVCTEYGATSRCQTPSLRGRAHEGHIGFP